MDDILEAFNRGDRAAFSVLFRTYFSMVFNYTNRLLRNPAEAEDITSKTFLKCWNLRGNFKTRENLIAFLHVTAKNAFMDEWRRNRMESEKMKRLQELSNEFNMGPVETDSETERLIMKIYAEIDKLPERCGEIFKLSYIEEMKNSEIAALLGVSEKTVRNQTTLARKLLRMKFLNKDLLIAAIITGALHIHWSLFA